MLTITLHDLRHRLRQFLIAVVGAGLVLSVALLLTGMSNSFRLEVRRTVASVGADAWVVPAGSSGPFTSFGALAEDTLEEVARADGVSAADPLVILPVTTSVDGVFEALRLVGHRLGGLGTPEPVDGRSATGSGEVVADARLGVEIGERLEVSGVDLEVVGLVEGLSLQGGIPTAYTSIDDARAIAFGGQRLSTAVVTEGVPARVRGDVAVMSPAEVRADTIHAMTDAVASIDNSRALMWVVAAIIIAALVYVSSLERLRDFAVLKSLGSSSTLLFLGVALQAVLVTLLAAAFAAAASVVMRPMFPLPVVVPLSAYVLLPVVAVAVGLLSSLVALRRAVSVDPASAFAMSS